MTWLKTDDGYYDHPKIRALTLAEYVLHHGGQVLCARLETDGVITRDQIDLLVRKGLRNPTRVVKSLVEQGLWIEVEGGWQIHDFLDYNPSRAQKKKEREDGARRQRESRERRARDSQQPVTGMSHRDITSDKPVTDTVSHSDPTRPDPTPIGDKPLGSNSRSLGDRVRTGKSESDAWALTGEVPS